MHYLYIAEIYYLCTSFAATVSVCHHLLYTVRSRKAIEGKLVV